VCTKLCTNYNLTLYPKGFCATVFMNCGFQEPFSRGVSGKSDNVV